MTGAGPAMVDVRIQDPHGSDDSIRSNITKKSDDLWLVEYSTNIDGKHSIHVLFGGKLISGSPFYINSLPREYLMLFHMSS